MPCEYTYIHSTTRNPVELLGPCFKTGRTVVSRIVAETAMSRAMTYDISICQAAIICTTLCPIVLTQTIYEGSYVCVYGAA